MAAKFSKTSKNDVEMKVNLENMTGKDTKITKMT